MGVNDSDQIAKLREQLVVKNGLLRSIKSRINDRERTREIVRKKQQQIDLLVLQIADLDNILTSGPAQCIDLIDEIESLEDELSKLLNASDIKRLAKLVAKLRAGGVDASDADCQAVIDRLIDDEGNVDEGSVDESNS